MKRSMTFALLLVLGTVSPLCQAQTPLQLAKPHRLPPHEVKVTQQTAQDSFLAWRPDGHALLYANGKGIAEYPGSRRSLPGVWPLYARWNKQGTKVLIGNKEQAWLIDERRFKVLRRYGSDTQPVVSAWWNGDHIGLLKTDLKHPLHFPASEHPIGADGEDYLYAQYVLENGRRLSVPRTVTLTATSDDGALFLGWKAVLHPHEANSIYQVVLLHLNRQHRFQSHPLLPVQDSKGEGLGDFICASPAHDLVFGLGGDPNVSGYWNEGYYSSRTGKTHVIALDDVIRPEVFFVVGHFIGVCRFTDSPTSTPAHPLDLSPYPAIEDYRFTCTGGHVRLEALPFLVTGYAVSLATSREAFLDQDHKLVIRPLSFADKPGKIKK